MPEKVLTHQVRMYQIYLFLEQFLIDICPRIANITFDTMKTFHGEACMPRSSDFSSPMVWNLFTKYSKCSLLKSKLDPRDGRDGRLHFSNRVYMLIAAYR